MSWRNQRKGNWNMNVQESSERKWIQREAVNKGAQEGNEQDDQEEADGGREASHKHKAVVQTCH